ncbi:MAG: hypothetical protein RLN70_03560 [Rhodospirillaceae bacterium]
MSGEPEAFVPIGVLMDRLGRPYFWALCILHVVAIVAILTWLHLPLYAPLPVGGTGYIVGSVFGLGVGIGLLVYARRAVRERLLGPDVWSKDLSRIRFLMELPTIVMSIGLVIFSMIMLPSARNFFALFVLAAFVVWLGHGAYRLGFFGDRFRKPNSISK